MEIFDLFSSINETLLRLENLVSGLIVVVFFLLIFQLSVARNTQVTARQTSTPPKRKIPSIGSRLRRRLRPSDKDQLPEGDTKELTEK